MKCSQLKLTYQGLVLLDHDDLIEREPELPVSGESQPVSFAGATTGRVFARGNERQSASWTRVSKWASHAEAVGVAVARRKQIRLGQTGTLIIEVKDGATFELRDFVMESLRASPMEHTGFPVREEYAGQGGELVMTDRNGLLGDEMGDDTRLIGAAGETATMAAEIH